MKRLAILLITLLGIPSLAFAKAPVFQVEVIAFEQGLNQADNQYQWPLEPGEPNWQHALSFNEDSEIKSSLIKTEQLPVLLPETSNELAVTHKAFLENKNYKILYHRTWQQPLAINQKGTPIRVENDTFIVDKVNDKTFRTFDGVLSIKSVRQGFIVKADFLLRKPSNKSLSTNLQSYRLKSAGKVKQKELYYFDHPLMGMIVYIQKKG